MTVRTRPEMVATRVTKREKQLVKMAAGREGVTVSDFLHSLIIPEVRKRLVEELEEGENPGPRVG